MTYYQSQKHSRIQNTITHPHPSSWLQFFLLNIAETAGSRWREVLKGQLWIPWHRKILDWGKVEEILSCSTLFLDWKTWVRAESWQGGCCHGILIFLRCSVSHGTPCRYISLVAVYWWHSEHCWRKSCLCTWPKWGLDGIN